MIEKLHGALIKESIVWLIFLICQGSAICIIPIWQKVDGPQEYLPQLSFGKETALLANGPDESIRHHKSINSALVWYFAAGLWSGVPKFMPPLHLSDNLWLVLGRRMLHKNLIYIEYIHNTPPRSRCTPPTKPTLFSQIRREDCTSSV